MTMTGSLPYCVILGNIFFLDKRKYSQNANGCGCGYWFVAMAVEVCIYLKEATSRDVFWIIVLGLQSVATQKYDRKLQSQEPVAAA